jgi:hypothetical protein
MGDSGKMPPLTGREEAVDRLIRRESGGAHSRYRRTLRFPAIDREVDQETRSLS